MAKISLESLGVLTGIDGCIFRAMGLAVAADSSVDEAAMRSLLRDYQETSDTNRAAIAARADALWHAERDAVRQ